MFQEISIPHISFEYAGEFFLHFAILHYLFQLSVFALILTRSDFLSLTIVLKALQATVDAVLVAFITIAFVNIFAGKYAWQAAIG